MNVCAFIHFSFYVNVCRYWHFFDSQKLCHRFRLHRSIGCYSFPLFRRRTLLHLNCIHITSAIRIYSGDGNYWALFECAIHYLYASANAIFVRFYLCDTHEKNVPSYKLCKVEMRLFGVFNIIPVFNGIATQCKFNEYIVVIVVLIYC